MTWLLLLLIFAALLAVGSPVVAAIALSATATLLINLPVEPALVTIVQRMTTGLDSFSLLAIPLFLLSGEIMHRGGAARRLVDLGRALVGRLPGGLLLVNITACILFGAISGSAVAATAAIGGFMIPLMERHGLPRPLSTATNLTAATTGLLIPPSNILIVYALASGGVSVAALFLAGYIPGLLVGLLLMVVAIISARRLAQQTGLDISELAPPPPLVASAAQALPSLFLVVFVMGGIVAGVFTATEAAGFSVLYALALTLLWHRELKVRDLYALALRTVRTSSVVLLLVAASMALSWVMAYENIPQRLASALLSIADNEVLLLLLINALLLAVGTVLDMTPAVLIFTPILLPVVQQIGIDPVHFGIILVLNLCIGLCTPPVGTVLFVGMATGKVSLRQLLPPLLPLYLALIVALVLVTLIPALSLWLPSVLGF